MQLPITKRSMSKHTPKYQLLQEFGYAINDTNYCKKRRNCRRNITQKINAQRMIVKRYVKDFFEAKDQYWRRIQVHISYQIFQPIRDLGTYVFLNLILVSEKPKFLRCRFWTLSDERRSRSKIFPLFIWIKEPCVRKFEGLKRSKLLGISQTICSARNKCFRWKHTWVKSIH